MHGALLLELLSQVIESLQAADLGQQPLLVALLHLLQTLPGIGNILEKRQQEFLPILSTLIDRKLSVHNVNNEKYASRTF